MAENRVPGAATSRLPYSCGRCTKRWGGLKTSHCVACHATFSTVANFDLHRRDGRCVPPHEIAALKLSGSRLGSIWVGAGASDHWDDEEE